MAVIVKFFSRIFSRYGTCLRPTDIYIGIRLIPFCSGASHRRARRALMK